MTINTITGKSVIYVCPVCGGETRGLMNGVCNRCNTDRLDLESYGNDVYHSFLRAKALDEKFKR